MWCCEEEGRGHSEISSQYILVVLAFRSLEKPFVEI